MKQQLDLEGSMRSQRGKNASRRLRREGRVPAVVYGLQKDALAITLDSKEMTRILASPAGHNRILNLKLDGAAEPLAAMAVDWQVDPVRGSLLHVDVQRVDLQQKVSVTVPIKTVGVAVGVKEQGGFEEVVTREIEIECLPLDVPEQIEIDITNLGLGQSIRAKDLLVGDNWTLRTSPNRVLVHVVAKKAEEVVEEVAAPVAAAGEPGAAPAETPKPDDKKSKPDEKKSKPDEKKS